MIIPEYIDSYKKKHAIASDSELPKRELLSLQAMVQASGKLVLVDKLLPKLKAGGHKVLIFSQMIRVLDIIEDYLIQKRFTYERLDGRIRGEMRQEAIDRYSKPDSDRFAFLLCTRAGGLGINLTAADTVIIYDSDWNPQNDLQAQARCHRIGQQKSVKIYRLITRNTYEREMFDKASLKLGLDKAILQSMRNEQQTQQAAAQSLASNREQSAASAQQAQQLSKKEIEDLLKKGAYGAIMEQDETDADRFCEEDIDKILEQRTTVIQLEGAGAPGGAGEKAGSTFSKASFQTSDSTSEISIDDPEFWQKWAKKADLDVADAMNAANKDERIIYEPRRRTQTRRYGGPDDIVEGDEEFSSASDAEGGANAGAVGGAPGGDKKATRGSKKTRRGRAAAAAAAAAAEGDGDGQAGENAGGDEAEAATAVMWSRDDLYKIEKSLMQYGWSRWAKILAESELKPQRAKAGGHVAASRTERDVEQLARLIVAHALVHYQGDESLKKFFTELITATTASAAAAMSEAADAAATTGDTQQQQQQQLKDLATTLNQATPVATRGRKPNAKESSKTPAAATSEQAAVAEGGEENVALHELIESSLSVLADDNYKKHVQRHANRILLRLRMLFYIRHEMLGDELAAKLDAADGMWQL